jgi:hypothetical protein
VLALSRERFQLLQRLTPSLCPRENDQCVVVDGGEAAMETITRTLPLLTSIAYAKNVAHEKFVLGFDGQLKGRYVIAFLVAVEYLGGAALRKAIERELGDPLYVPDQWTPARDMIVIFDRAARAGVSVERMGELVIPAYKRAHPEAFVGKTVLDASDILERGYRNDTTYGGVSPEAEKSPGRLRAFRANSPVPCQYFVGVIRGLLQVLGTTGTVHEVACQWEGGGKSCCFEARWI